MQGYGFSNCDEEPLNYDSSHSNCPCPSESQEWKLECVERARAYCMQKAAAECDRRKHAFDFCRRLGTRPAFPAAAARTPYICRDRKPRGGRVCEDDDRAKFLSLKARFQAITKDEQDRIRAKCEEKMKLSKLQRCAEKICQTPNWCYKVDIGVDCKDLSKDKNLEDRLCQLENMLSTKNTCVGTETEKATMCVDMLRDPSSMMACDETPACPPFCPPPCPPPCPPQCCSPAYSPCAPHCSPVANPCPPIDPLCPPLAEFVTDPDNARSKVHNIEQKLSNLGCQMNTSVINKCLYQEQIARLEEEIVNTKRAYFSVLMSELNNLQSDLDAHECLLKDGPTPAPEGPILKTESKPKTPQKPQTPKKKKKKKPTSAKGKGGNRSASSKRPASARSKRPTSARSTTRKAS